MSIFDRRTGFIDNIIFNILTSGKESIVLLSYCLPTFSINNDIVLVVIWIPINHLLYSLSLKSWIWFRMSHSILWIYLCRRILWCYHVCVHFWWAFQLCEYSVWVILPWWQVRDNRHTCLLQWCVMLRMHKVLLLRGLG